MDSDTAYFALSQLMLDSWGNQLIVYVNGEETEAVDIYIEHGKIKIETTI